MKNMRNSLRAPASIPEVAAFLQEDSSITGKINLSVAEENALLKERNRQLETDSARKDARISELEEREAALVRDDVETSKAVIEAFQGIPEIDADLFAEYAQTLIGNATNNRETATALHHVAVTAANLTEIVRRGRR